MTAGVRVSVKDNKRSLTTMNDQILRPVRAAQFLTKNAFLFFIAEDVLHTPRGPDVIQLELHRCADKMIVQTHAGCIVAKKHLEWNGSNKLQTNSMKYDVDSLSNQEYPVHLDNSHDPATHFFYPSLDG